MIKNIVGCQESTILDYTWLIWTFHWVQQCIYVTL